MVKDQLFKRLFIPLTGICFPLLAGMINGVTDPWMHVALGFCFFTVVVFLLWNGTVRCTILLRRLNPLKKSIFLKVVFLSLVAAVYASALSFISAVAWLRIGKYPFVNEPVLRATWLGAFAGILLALVYEVVCLSVEKELDMLVLQQVDRERQEAEVNMLKNELDPHFFFNCMNSLSYLVKQDQDKAHQFVHALSNIYKYFLRNKAVDYVPLNDELTFLENYAFLLRIRFEDSIRIENSIDPCNGTASILPCALQVLVENAMKHNHFSEKEPLIVNIGMNNFYVTVYNPVRPKPHAAESTKIGLRNLKARYRIITNQNVLVHKTATRFIVQLPVIKQTNRYDKSSDH